MSFSGGDAVEPEPRHLPGRVAAGAERGRLPDGVDLAVERRAEIDLVDAPLDLWPAARESDPARLGAICTMRNQVLASVSTTSGVSGGLAT